MKRAIVTPAVLPPSALAELKQWLGITTAHDDAPLAALLRMALETCEAFTGVMPIECVCEELLDATGGWQDLSTRPVQAITAVQTIQPSGARTNLAASDYAVDLGADGTGRVMILVPDEENLVAVRFTAGLVPSWDQLPEVLRQGVIRLAAHQHRERETSGAGPVPPASVAALWRPWRRLRLV